MMAGPVASSPALRLLLLAPFPPRLDAVHGGGRTVARLMEGLASRHRIALLYLRAADEPAGDPRLGEWCEVVGEIARPGPGSGRVRRGWERLGTGIKLLAGKPVWISKWAVPAYAARLRTLAREWQPDIVQLEFAVMGQYLPALSGCRAPRVLTVHDPAAAAARDQCRAATGVARALHALEVRSWERYERTIIQSVDTAVVFTDQDRRAIEQLAAVTPVTRIPLGHTVPKQALDPVGVAPPGLVFIGNFMHPPNLDAAERLARAILPRVRAGCPDAVLHIIGDRPPPHLCHMADDHLVVTGRVPDVTPYLDRAAVVAVPLRQGGGMRVKVMEALALGKAVVASPRAVQGLDVRDGHDVLIAETDEEFAEAILQLLRDPDRRAALAARARARALEQPGWNDAVAAYDALYGRLPHRARSAAVSG